MKGVTMADEVKETNKQLVCEIKIDTEILQKIIDEKVAQIKLDIQEIRNQAIDEFAEQMQEKVESFQAEINGIRADLLTLDYFSEFVFEIAEQMKGE